MTITISTDRRLMADKLEQLAALNTEIAAADKSVFSRGAYAAYSSWIENAKRNPEALSETAAVNLDKAINSAKQLKQVLRDRRFSPAERFDYEKSMIDALGQNEGVKSPMFGMGTVRAVPYGNFRPAAPGVAGILAAAGALILTHPNTRQGIRDLVSKLMPGQPLPPLPGSVPEPDLEALRQPTTSPALPPQLNSPPPFFPTQLPWTGKPMVLPQGKPLPPLPPSVRTQIDLTKPLMATEGEVYTTLIRPLAENVGRTAKTFEDRNGDHQKRLYVEECVAAALASAEGLERAQALKKVQEVGRFLREPRLGTVPDPNWRESVKLPPLSGVSAQEVEIIRAALTAAHKRYDAGSVLKGLDSSAEAVITGVMEVMRPHLTYPKEFMRSQRAKKLLEAELRKEFYGQ